MIHHSSYTITYNTYKLVMLLSFLEYCVLVYCDEMHKSLLVRSGTLLYMQQPTYFTSSHLFS